MPEITYEPCPHCYGTGNGISTDGERGECATCVDGYVEADDE